MEMLEWDARTYDTLPLPHEHWGARAIAQLRLNGNETILDLGCGTGRDAEHLLDLLPHGSATLRRYYDPVDSSSQRAAATETS